MNGEHRYQFVDTNVLLYAHKPAAGYRHDVASELVRRLWHLKTGCVSIQVLQEFYVNASRGPRPAEARAEASQAVRRLTQWHTHCPCANDILEAIRLHERYQISFWDAMVITSAAQLGCDVVWSEDLNSGQSYDGVVVRNPFV